jgi:hypothetical protein
MFECFGLARALACAAGLALLLPGSAALAEDREPREPPAILQFGAGSEWGLNGGSPGFGPMAAVEFTPIKNWLEVETGVATLFSKGKTEWDIDFIFKKPFDLSPSIEFEPGLGPVWMRTVGGGRMTDAVGAEAVFEFMFWPTADRKYGWFLEPSYTYSFARGHEQSFGVSGGLLIPIR